MIRRYFRHVLLTCILALVLAPQGRADARYVLITILHTNDMHGRVLPRDEAGGLARAATLIRQIRAEMPNVLLLDAGDIIHGTPEEYYSGGRAIISAMNAVGYNAAVTGNHEYDFGLAILKGAIESARFPFVSANVRAASGDQWEQLAPYIMLDVDGVKVAILGLTTPDTVSFQWSGRMMDIAIGDPIAAANSLVPELRAQADVVVALTHLGEEQDMALAEQVAGIDFVVGGHTHSVIDEWRWVGDTLVAQAGAYARSLGRIDLVVQKTAEDARIISVNGKGRRWNDLDRPPLGLKYPNGPLIPVDDLVPEDSAVREAYRPFRAETDARLGQVIGHAPRGIPGGAGETAIGSMIADAVREFAQADAAVVDANSISATGIRPGAISVRSCFNLIGGYTRQHIVIARMTGAELKLGLEKRLAGRSGVGAQVSGVSFQYTLKAGLAAVTKLMVGEEPVEHSRTYTVAAQAHVMMEMMKSAPGIVVLAEPAETVREATVNYVRARGTIDPPPPGRMRWTEPVRP